MKTSLDYNDIKDIFKGGARNLEINKAYVDSLNVFPVPDGDTGTNMSLTMVSTIKELDLVESGQITDLCTAFSTGALKGARGNSGVILSQILKGMAEIMKKAKAVTTRVFAQALKHGSNVAYDVVTNPKEGTILTVIRLMGDYAVKIASKKPDFFDFMPAILKQGYKVLDDTPNLLPVLKKAGVVDAGGKGLLIIIEGIYNVLAGIEMAAIVSQDEAPSVAEDTFTPDIHNLDEIEFAYCTEFFIINLKPITTSSSIAKLRDKLTDIGDSVIVVGDLNLVKVHVHTNRPDKALGYALELGEIDKPKIENMLEQSREFKREVEKKVVKSSGLVAICVGEGIKAIFEELNADSILEGGQTMNPSVSDIVEAVEKVGAKTVYILPNNSNIILAAEQAKDLVKCNLVVIATKDIPQGIAAAINFNPDAESEENTRNMQKAADGIKCGQVTSSVKDTEIDGFKLKNGDIIGLFGKEVVASGEDVAKVTKEVIEKMVTKNTASITLYYGNDVIEEQAMSLLGELEELYNSHDVMMYYGGQCHYHYFVSVE